jgi:dynamin 1-like protein
MNHIRDKLPDMKARLNTLMGQARQELNSFGDAAIYGDKNQVVLFSYSPSNKTVKNKPYSKAP